jgi:DNA-binding MarR family transcriptional regulator
MKQDGLVATRVRRDDGRGTEVMLTEKGINAVEDIRFATKDLFKQSFKGMTEAKIQRLNKLLEELFHNLPEH